MATRNTNQETSFGFKESVNPTKELQIESRLLAGNNNQKTSFGYKNQ